MAENVVNIIAEFVPSARGGALLKAGGFLYRKDYAKNGKTYYKCHLSICTARAVVDGDVISKRTGEHGHPSDATEITKKRFASNLKEAAVNTKQPISRLYRVQAAAAGMENLPPTLSSIRDSAYRARRKTVPPLPQTAEAYVVEPQVVEHRVISDTRNAQNHRMIIITSNVLLRNLQVCERLQFDGTFASVPDIFLQLYIIHGKVLGVWQPLIFSLLPSKTFDTYQRLWREVHRLTLEETGLALRSNYLIGDFETGALTASVSEWPVLPVPVVKGCLFHFSQSILKKTRKYGLWISYQEDDIVRQFVRRFMGLPFVPLDRIDDACLTIIGDAPEPEHAEFDKCQRLQDYVVRTWADDDAKFARNVWNHYGEDDDRTSNAAESTHNRINGVCGKNRLNIHAYVRELSNELEYSQVKIGQIVNGGPLPKRRRAYAEVRDRLIRFRQEFETGARNLTQYLDACSHQVHDNLVR